MHTFTPIISLTKPKGKTIDLFENLLKEKFLIDDPKLYFAPAAEQEKSFASYLQKYQGEGVWVRHPWSSQTYHLLEREEYFQLRTARNKNLLSSPEQSKLHHKTIAVAGLSVGSNILFALIRYGVGEVYRIADSDSVAISNLNRTTYDLTSFGLPKIEVALKTMNQIDPFLSVTTFPEGLTKDNLPDFVRGADVIVDAFDQFELKIALRKEAQKQRVPVVSGFDIEKGVLLIAERYDIEKNIDLSIFLNSHTEEEILKPTSTAKEKTQLFIDIIGQQYHSKKMLSSVHAVGSELTGYPQLIIATLLAASLFTSAIEDILLERVTHSFRRYVSVTSEI